MMNKFKKIFFQLCDFLKYVLGFFLVGGPFVLGMLLGQRKLDTKIFFLVAFPISSFFSTIFINDLFLQPILAALPRFHISDKSITEASIANILIFLIGVICMSFNDSMLGSFKIWKISISKRNVAIIVVIISLSFIINYSQVRDNLPTKKMNEILTHSTLTEEDIKNIDSEFRKKYLIFHRE
jgi:hypothetical protein